MSRTYDRHPHDAGAFEDDYRGFDLRDDEGGRGPLILALAMGVFLIFGAVIWNTYKQGIKPQAGALPVVFADAEPYKRAPDNPGGTAADDLEHRIYDQIDGSARAPAATLVGGPPVELRPGRTSTSVDRRPVAADEPAVTTRALPGLTVTTDPLAEPEAASAAAVAPVQAPAPVETAAPAAVEPNGAFATDGAFLAQVSALRTQEAADAAWDQLVTSEGALLAGAKKEIQRADLGAKGVWFRVRVGAFDERAEASGFCDQLKARDRACIVVAR